MFLNTTETIGIIMGSAATTTTGSLFSALIMVMLVLLAICIMFQISLEWSSIFLMPYCIGCAAYYGNFVGPLGVILIYLSLILTKNWIYR